MEEDRATALWHKPVLGRDLLEQGIFARLRPYEIQVLRLTESGG
jgi:hypothetical protein